MSKYQSFIGKWEMMPNENKYQIGAPPKEGTYTIALVEENIIRFDVDWIDEQDKKHTMVYFSSMDGSTKETENNDLQEYVKTTFISDNKLESCIYKNGTKICYNLQQSIDDGKKLLVTQVGLLPDGGKIVNKSIYKKVHHDTF